MLHDSHSHYLKWCERAFRSRLTLRKEGQVALGGRRLIGLARRNVEAPADGVKTVFRGHQPLYDYLVGWGSFVQLDNFNPKYLPIFSRDVLKRIASGDDSWDEMVPPQVAEIIRQRGFFDYKKKA